MSPIVQDVRNTLGDTLRLARENKHLKIDELGQKLQISSEYILALENGSYHQLPSGVYVKNYMRKYAKEVGLSYRVLLNLYEQEMREYAPTVEMPAGPHMAPTDHTPPPTEVDVSKAVLIPQLLKIVAFIGGVGLVALYLVWQVMQFLTPPPFEITSPAEDVIVEEPFIEIVGISEPEARIEINGQQVSVDVNGEFREEIALHTGLNTLQITSKSRRSKEQTIVRHILYEGSEEEDVVENKEVSQEETVQEETE